MASWARKKFTDDGPNKYSEWRDVPVPLNYKSFLSEPPMLGSPVKAPERSQSEHEGILSRILGMYSPSFLRKTPNKLVSFPNNPDHNFIIRASPDLLVHRYDSGLKSWQVKYSTEEHMDDYLEQYGTNDLEDFSHLDPRVEDLVSTSILAEPKSASPS